jgi:hypothetical protein
MVVMVPSSSEGQLPVIDEANLQVNIEQARKLGALVAIAQEQLETMLQNLLPLLNQPAYPMAHYEELLLALSRSAGPREHAARTLDYFQNDLQPAMKHFFPGAIHQYEYTARYAQRADMELNTIESIIGRLNAEAGRGSDETYEITRHELRTENSAAAGILQAQQVGNLMSLFVADGVRRLEKSNTETANLIAVTRAFDRQKEAWGEAILTTALKEAYEEEPPLYNKGQGGIKYVGYYGTGQQ